jgi:hypothetical protein
VFAFGITYFHDLQLVWILTTNVRQKLPKKKKTLTEKLDTGFIRK